MAKDRDTFLQYMSFSRVLFLLFSGVSQRSDNDVWGGALYILAGEELDGLSSGIPSARGRERTASKCVAGGLVEI